ncbi:MAG TPA: DUF4838 domain-containing protein [Gemmataceae bacterium]|nr:DUF4838 domain-containing protein [Gemmataceae bacterium]
MSRFHTTVAALVLVPVGVPAADIVLAGKPVVTIVSDAKPAAKNPPKGRKQTQATGGESLATKLLVDWIQKITDAELPVSDKPTNGPAIYIGKAAERAGLKLDDIDSPTKEGVGIVVEEKRILIGGQCEAATVKAVCRFLEHLGCRYFMDGPLGEVFPRTTDLSVKPITITEKPGLLERNPKGPTWNAAIWKAWNGAGGENFAHAHSWGRYIPKGTFAEHPEYFAMGADGQRKDGDWLCTSNPAVREMFARQVISAIKGGNKNPSISPPDGRGYCQCEKCKAQDDPKSIEPSSGSVSMSNRYADFFDDIGRRVAKECPASVLCFYVYADYTQPPTTDKKLSSNLCAVIAPIRYCRLHALGDPDCPSRKQQVDMVDGWAKVASRLGYYNYMYNLADGTLPMFKFTPCQKEIPYLADRGLSLMTIEVLSNWYIYGPQIYLSLRMAYDPKLDPVAFMDDYYTKFYGPAAEPMKAYWTGIDQATAKLHNHAGGFHGLAAVYTPEFCRACDSRLSKAAAAAKGDRVYAERVAMHAAGFANVMDYLAICNGMAAGEVDKAKRIYDEMTERIDGLVAKGYANREYGTAYLRRFLSRIIEGGVVATKSPNKVVEVLPDQWRLAYDDAEQGEAKKFHTPEFDDSKWRKAATHSATLSGQGLRENTILWYRTTFRAPEKHDRLTLLFPEVDGLVTVYVNGKALEPTPVLAAPPKKKAKADAPAVPRRAPFEVDVTNSLREGDNLIAVRVDNRKISELFLGGILRPVILAAKEK